MRIGSLLALALMVLAACGGPAAGRDPVSTVQGIYTPYEAHAANPPALQDAAPWTADLRALIVAAKDVEGGIGFDPVIDGQDYDLSALAVTAQAPPSGGKATVEASFTNLGDPVTVTYDLVEEGGGWRVDDVRTAEWTLRGALAGIGLTPARVQEEAAK